MHFDVLDHGSLSLVTSWGSDESIIEAARMSTGKGFLVWGPRHTPACFAQMKGSGVCLCDFTTPGDEKLLRYLWTHKHHTPFEMCGFTVEVQAPIFVFREWHRHRSLSFNELSARYTPIPDVNYVPTMDRCFANSQRNKQAGTATGASTLDIDSATAWRFELEEFYSYAEELYQRGLRIGIPKELARLCIPVGRYSRMRASGNLRNWLAFYALRSAPDAQAEIQVYARCIGKVIAEKFPRVWEVVTT
jgi:thymidylate synthase (FAD)